VLVKVGGGTGDGLGGTGGPVVDVGCGWEWG
jgi:hypothetical protein